MTTRTDRHQTFDTDGNLIDEQVVVVDTTAETNERTVGDRLDQALDAMSAHVARGTFTATQRDVRPPPRPASLHRAGTHRPPPPRHNRLTRTHRLDL